MTETESREEKVGRYVLISLLSFPCPIPAAPTFPVNGQGQERKLRSCFLAFRQSLNTWLYFFSLSNIVIEILYEAFFFSDRGDL